LVAWEWADLEQIPSSSNQAMAQVLVQMLGLAVAQVVEQLLELAAELVSEQPLELAPELVLALEL